MRIQELASYRNEKNFSSPFYAELFCDDIWGDNGEDCASVTIHPTKEGWHLHYIRNKVEFLILLPHIPARSLMNMKKM